MNTYLVVVETVRPVLALITFATCTTMLIFVAGAVAELIQE